jgi:hypothetical protein
MMGVLSGLKRITAAVATGGLSLTQSQKRQEQIGTAIGVGTAIVAGGAAASSLFGTAAPEVPAAAPPGATGPYDPSLYDMGYGPVAAPAAAPSLTDSLLGAARRRLVNAVAPPSTGGAPTDTTGGVMPVSLTPGSPGGGLQNVVYDQATGQFIPAAAGMGGMISRGAAVAGGGVRILGNLIYSASGRIRGVMARGGQFLSAKRVYSGAKVLGLAAASGALGVSIDQLAQVVLEQASRPRRRGRGISGRDLRTTRRTTRTIIRMHSQLEQLCGQGGFRRRARPRPRAH